jgi:hypothetical protein
VVFDVGFPDDTIPYLEDSQNFLFENKIIEKKADDISKVFNKRFLEELGLVKR